MSFEVQRTQGTQRSEAYAQQSGWHTRPVLGHTRELKICSAWMLLLKNPTQEAL